MFDSDEILSMLWTLFPQSSILTNETLQNVPTPNANIEYDIVIPEYRLALDINTGSWRGLASDHAFVNNYRYEHILYNKHDKLSINWLRNEIINIINQLSIKKTAGPTELLSPRLPGDAGWDIVCGENTVCAPHTGTDIPSDLRMEIPNHLYGIIQARSSTSIKRLLVLPGVIDAAYRGKIYVMAFNLTDDPIVINKGDRIAQMLFLPRTPHLHMVMRSELSPSERGDKGFGHTGV
jgi:dUTP pyrophosphatase